MFDAYVKHFAVGIGLLSLLPSFCCGDQPEEKSVAQLKRDVAERERQLVRAQRELADARARVAQAEGKRDLAIAELRKVTAGYQSEVQWVQDNANWICDPRDLMTETQWDMAKARVRLAEAEGDTAALVAEWKKIVVFHEQQLERVQRLEMLRAVTPAEISEVQAELDKTRARLAEVEKKLPAERAKKGE
jgi:multidrug resistance efflux pump